MRLRSVAVPAFFVTVKPIPGCSCSVVTACRTRPFWTARRPRAAFRNCIRLVNRRRYGVRGPADTLEKGSGRKTLAAARPAGAQNLAAVLGRHPGTETMPAGAHQIAGLKCTLHCSKTALDTVPLLLLRRNGREPLGLYPKARSPGWAAYMKLNARSQRDRVTLHAHSKLSETQTTFNRYRLKWPGIDCRSGYERQDQ